MLAKIFQFKKNIKTKILLNKILIKKKFHTETKNHKNIINKKI